MIELRNIPKKRVRLDKGDFFTLEGSKVYQVLKVTEFSTAYIYERTVHYMDDGLLKECDEIDTTRVYPRKFKDIGIGEFFSEYTVFIKINNDQALEPGKTNSSPIGFYAEDDVYWEPVKWK